jgi:hypothetical protein
MKPEYAKAILAKLGSTGTPPEFGIETFSVGLERYLRIIETEYLDGHLKYNLSSVKLITGNYGGGKTHFLYSIRNLAFKHNYVVAYVSLNPTECPFDRLELVYRQIATNLMPPMKEEDLVKPGERGIDVVIKTWFRDVRSRVDHTQALAEYLVNLGGTESISFLNAVKGCFSSLVAEDPESFDAVLQWLKGEEAGKDIRGRYRIAERIDKTTAFRMLRSLSQWIRAIGYSGLILLFDEAERGVSVSSSRDRRRALDNLRQIVDECGNSRLPGAMFFYAIPDENLLLDGQGGVYEALKQRLRSALSDTNPVGVKINLEDLGIDGHEFLKQLGHKLAALFATGYDFEFDRTNLEKSIDALAELALTAFAFDVSYRRLFVIGAIEAFHRIKNDPRIVIGKKEAEEILKVTTGRLSEESKEKVESEEF